MINISTHSERALGRPAAAGQVTPEPYETVAADAAFQAACQRYAHANGSSYAIADAALKAIGHGALVGVLREAEKAWRRAISDPHNATLACNIQGSVVHLNRLREALAAHGAEPLP
ncbi:MAG: hypothetical protein F9K29_07860 [Hyphomicrobiaceae bacterium]|nr:MAG: hypothetical protein F9K29_07860 [Hyphomicrobiaceae bacterium]